MTEQKSQSRPVPDDEIGLIELFGILWRGKWIIIAITFIFAVGSVVYALSLPNIYAAEAKLAPTEESQGRGGLGEMSGQLGGLASLAGISVGQEQITDAVMAREIMQSRKFIADFVNGRGIQADLLAVEEWDEDSGELIYNRKVFNPDSQEWVRNVEPPKEQVPNDWELVEEFRKHFSIEDGLDSALLNLKIEHRSPVTAKQWVDWIVEDINDEMRRRDIEEAQRSIKYIDREMTNAQLRSTQQIYSGLMEQQQQTIMLANVRPEYIYRVVDPAVIPKEREKPKRSMIVIFGTFLGGFFSIIIVFITHLIRKISNPF